MEKNIFLAIDPAEAAKLIHILTERIGELELTIETQKGMLEKYARKIAEMEQQKEDDF